MKTFHYRRPFALECGAYLPELEIAYTAYGRLDAARSNVVWICHALTGNADPMEWWSGLVGRDKLFDPAKHFIVCANMLGSCYGTTGPASRNPATGKPYGRDFPLITIRDMAAAHELLRKHLGIYRIDLCIGGSMGGQQALEWAIQQPELFERLCLLATNARHSPWGIAFNESQRMALEADPTLWTDTPEAGRKGLEAARAIAMLSYRNYETYRATQDEEETDKWDRFRAGSYQRYQGTKLWKRFHPHAYLTLSKAMDSHNVGRGRGGVVQALRRVQARTLVIGIRSDVLFPVEEQVELARHIPHARLELIDSLFGHDGFLVEAETIAPLVGFFMQGAAEPYSRELKLETELCSGFRQFRKVALPGTEPF